MPTLVRENGQIKVLARREELRSNDAEEFLSQKPGFMIRWGITMFLAILVLLCVTCWFIQYPDIIQARARLSSINAPKPVVTRTDGRIIKLLADEGKRVENGQVLGYMESIADAALVEQLAGRLDSIAGLIAENRTNDIVKYFPGPAAIAGNSGLGEIQNAYQVFIQSFTSFRDFLNNGFYLRKRTMLTTDMQTIQKQESILTQQKGLLTQDLALSKETFEANESLARDKVISPLEWRDQKSRYLGKQLTLPQISSAIVSNQEQQQAKRKEIAELENQIAVQKNIFMQALQTIRSEVRTWENKYLLRAPMGGQVSYAGFIQENQEIRSGQTIFYIQPANSEFFAEMLIPQYNFGKVKPGQQVLLKFQSYPFEQYGAVPGIITHINASPTDSGYLAKVQLPQGLRTNYNKPLQYRYGLFAQANIITENMRLTERFYYNIRKQLER